MLLDWSMSLPFIVFQSRLSCTVVITLRSDISLITVLWLLRCHDLACSMLCWEFNSTWPSRWIRLGHQIGNNPEVSGQPSLTRVFCSFPQTAWKETLFQREICTLCSQWSSEELLIFTADFITVGVVSNVQGGTSEFYSHLLNTEDFDVPSELLFLQRASLCHSWPGWALEGRICSVGLCHGTVLWIVIYVWLLSSTGRLVALGLDPQAQWVVHLLGYIELHFSDGGFDGGYNSYYFLKAYCIWNSSKCFIFISNNLILPIIL